MSLENDLLKPGILLVFLFTLACERIFIKMHSTESRCVIKQENTLFAGASGHLSAGNFTGGDSDGLINKSTCLSCPYFCHQRQEIVQAGAVKGLLKKSPCLSSRCVISAMKYLALGLWNPTEVKPAVKISRVTRVLIVYL